MTANLKAKAGIMSFDEIIEHYMSMNERDRVFFEIYATNTILAIESKNRPVPPKSPVVGSSVLSRGPIVIPK